jgi:hypothetical protein
VETRASKKTSNPASDRQKRVIGRLVNLLLAYETWESIDEARNDFFERTGYNSIKEISRYQGNILLYEYADVLRAQVRERAEWRRLRRCFYE